MPDWTKLLELAPLLLMKPGSPQGAAAIQGFLQSQENLRQRDIQGQQLAGQEELRQSQMRNVEADNQRAEAQLALQRISAARGEGNQALEALAQAPETYLPPGTDPLQAQNQLVIEQFKAQQAYGVPAGTPQAPLPNMTQLVSEGKKRRAKARYDAIVKSMFGGNEAAAMQAYARDVMGEFQGMTPADIRGVFSTPMVTAAGQPVTPITKDPESTAVGGFDAHFADVLAAEEERQQRPLTRTEKAQLRLKARKDYQQADDRPQSGATVVIQTVDAQGNPVTRIVPKTAGAQFAAPPTGAQRQQVAENEAVTTGLARIKELAPDIETLSQWVGPVVGRTNSIRLVTPGLDVDPKMAEFFAEVAAIKNRMIRAITGAQMSEPEAARIMAQLPDIALKPSVFLARLQATERNLAALNSRIAAQSGVGGLPTTGGGVEYDFVPGKGLVPRKAR